MSVLYIIFYFATIKFCIVKLCKKISLVGKEGGGGDVVDVWYNSLCIMVHLTKYIFLQIVVYQSLIFLFYITTKI
jgi:hypothetical protein